MQTILQMKGFLEEVKRRGGSRYRATAADAQQRVPPEAGAINCAPPDDPWFYKNEYNGMLMASVAVKRDEVLAGKASARATCGPMRFVAFFIRGMNACES